MKVLVVGSGGREHAVVWKLSQSRLVQKIYCVPGNAGTAEIATNLNLSPTDFAALITVVEHEKIDFTIVGPEEPLVRGIVDRFTDRGLKIFGPTQAAARLEGSKVFAKNLLQKYQIPTARGEVFGEYQPALAYLRKQAFPLVVKADGLAAGKGVYVCDDLTAGELALREIFLEQKFGAAGQQVIIEEFIGGEEVSALVLTDSHTYVELPSAQDHKRIFDNDQGPNTGGMGAYSPAPILDPALAAKIAQKVWRPLFAGFKQEGLVYKGVLYAGLMIKDGEPYVLEFNARFGDPETQVILPRLESDLAELLLAVSEERLSEVDVRWSENPAVCVVLAAQGYPGSYEKGQPISGLENIKDPRVMVFHAGTKKEQGRIVTNGGRVLNVCAAATNLKESLALAYQAAAQIDFAGKQYRKDIAQRALRRMS